MEESLSMSRGLCSYALLSRGCFGRRNEIYRGGLRATTSHASLSPPDLFVPGPKGRERLDKPSQNKSRNNRRDRRAPFARDSDERRRR